MGNRYYHYGCPKTTWDKGIAFLLPEYKKMAEECISPHDLRLMKDNPVRADWVYFVTEKYSKEMNRVIEYYLSTLGIIRNLCLYIHRAARVPPGKTRWSSPPD